MNTPAAPDSDYRLDVYDRRPWLAHYAPGLGAHLRIGVATALDMFDATVAAHPDDIAIAYFDRVLTWSELDHAAGAVAALLIARGFAPGDRMALILQNDPAFVIGLIAAWRAGGVAATLSPMSTADELAARLGEYTPTALLALDDIYEDRLRNLLGDGNSGIRVVLTASPISGVSSPDARLFSDADFGRRAPADTIDLDALIAGWPTDGTVPARPVGPLDTAVLMATSGTTGPPKGARLTHANLVFSAHVYRDWTGATRDPVLGASPVFHVTGLIGGVMLATLLGATLVLTHRFHPEVMADAIRRHRPGFMVAVITAYIALADESSITATELEPLRLRLSGGAPIDPETAQRIADRLGGYIHNVYGLTETTSPTHMVPLGRDAPVDPETGVLSVGVPVFDTSVRVVDESGADLPAGEIGELVVAGPQVVDGYWQNPRASADTFVGGELRTGDLGFMDADGWFYIIDRKSELINASGYKVWPTEVERIVRTHPAVVDVAVVGIPDEYRGESVKAFVVLAEPDSVSEAGLIDYCRDRLAAFKYPREIEIVGELPRSATGKLLRRKLR
ncbi:AMP-binding protein [Gordonia sp. VNQ95]|jgi:long-chain acyl-CoA synthetase|uniref:class I adenylate-forming enzyme family protein n=1 Tax=Gordonia TaxID=2053 RepID=UPI0032B509EC